jgi:bacteriocin biosynthesis cyclodehydratase domain-containing protein
MATAIHLSQPPSAVLVPCGRFGQDVAASMLAEHPGCLTYPDDALEAAFANPGAAVVLPAQGPNRTLCARADELSYATGQPWLPVVMEQRKMTVGPLVCPPAGPCHGCLVRRYAQHDSQPDETRALDSVLESGTRSGPMGYLPHHARLAAGLAMTVLTRGTRGLPGEGALAGAIVTVHLPRCAVTESRVVACHDCRRCHGNANPRQPPQSLSNALRQLRDSTR